VFFWGVVLMRPNLIAGRAMLAAVAVVGPSLAAGCAGGHAAKPGSTSTAAGSDRARSASAWSAATAMRRVRTARVSVGGRAVKVDPTTLVCWGVGRSQRRGATRLWRRFDCIAPTFRGAAAGPDLLFSVQPTGRARFRIERPRLTSYGGG
jgi:hypothetical protein